MLFTQTLNGVASWADNYQSTEAFDPLVREIFLKHSLCYSGIKNLTPGSNAVFLAGNLVIKIFSPKEAGLSAGEVFFIEKAALKHANNTIPSPHLLYSGTIHDKYSFQYIIMDYIKGQEFKEKLKYYTSEQKRHFATVIKAMSNEMNIPIAGSSIPVITKYDCIENSRWDHFPKSFCEDRLSVIRTMSFDDPVYVHGDLKAANVIIGEGDDIYIIDFADSHIAPIGYEWPFLVFGLFGCDNEMMAAFFGDYRNDAFYTRLTNHLLMHKFGAFILMQICELKGIPISTIADVESLYRLIKECIQNGDVLID